jgi:hypothetical protein
MRAGRFAQHQQRQAVEFGRAAVQQPAGRREAVVHRALQGHARHEPVVDRDHGGLAGMEQCRVVDVVHAGIAGDPAAAVDVEHDRAHRTGRAQHPERHARSAGRRETPLDPDAAPCEPAVGAQLRHAHGGLGKQGREAVADPEARQARQQAVEAAHRLQLAVVQRDVCHG